MKNLSIQLVRRKISILIPSELGRQNGIPVDGSGKMVFPDFGTKTYNHPRIALK